MEIKYFNPGDHVNPVKTVVFTYDKVGNLLTYDDGVTSGEYFYDNAYRKVSETVNYGSFIKTYDYTYLKNGTKETFTGPDGITYGYLYDPNNQLTGVQIPNSGFITISEYTWNRPKSMILPGGSTKQFEYDPLMRVKSITAKDPGQNVLLNYQYTFDKMDNITGKVTEHGDYDYDYDDLYRLTDVDNPDFDDEAFTYDGVGNRLTSEGVIGDWSYNTNNELTGYDDASYVYDNNGNMTQKTVSGVVTKFFYNLADKLTEVRDGSDALIATYYYDPFGRRLWKEVAGVRTYFHYADEGLIGEYDSTGTEIKSYGWKPGSVWGTNPLFIKEGSSYFFYHTDHLGTPQKMTAVNGAVVWSTKYSSFGKADIDAASTITNNLRFPGQYYDAETGLNYNYFRYLDPKTGRYLKVDPVGLLAGVNLFSYVHNDPVNYIDAKGLSEYGGYCRYISGGQGAGVGVLRCRVWTECGSKSDTREVGELVTVFGGLTAGYLPAGVTYFDLSLEDTSCLNSDPTLENLTGFSTLISASGAGGFGGYVGNINLGNTQGTSTGGPQAGVDASVDLFAGYSWLDWVRTYDCCTGEEISCRGACSGERTIFEP